MPVLNVYANKSAVIIYDGQNHGADTRVQSDGTQYGNVKTVLIGFPTNWQSVQYKKLTSIKFAVWYQITSGSGDLATLSVTPLSADFDQYTVTNQTKPGSYYSYKVDGQSYTSVDGEYIKTAKYAQTTHQRIMYIFNNGIEATIGLSGANCIAETAMGTHKPYAEITYDDVDAGLEISSVSPESGYIDKSSQSVFSWTTTAQQITTISEVKQSSARLIWRKTGEATEHTVNVSGSSKTVTVPANTFPSPSIDWKIEVTANSGVVTESPWHTVSTIEPTGTAIAESPANEAVDATAPIEFTWIHQIETGTMQSAYELEKSQDGASWSQFKSGSQQETRATIPKNTFSSGTWFWRVRTANTDGVFGEWSEPAMFIAIGAPSTPSITIVSNDPRFEIRWSQTGQVAYAVRIDNGEEQQFFGTNSNYKHSGYLADGDHEVCVKIQNAIGLWSEWASVSITVANQSGGTVTLTAAEAENAPEVILEAFGEEGDGYIFLRDGVEIGRTNQPTFTDRFAIGHATYSVFVTYNDSGNYSASDGAEADVSVKVPWLYSAKTKQWVPLKMSEKETNGLSQSYSITAAFLHFAGSHKPSVEYGVSSDRSMSFSVGFLNDSEDLQKFLAMVGGTVCAKWPDGDMIIGAMFNWERQHGRIYTEFSTKIIETEFDEVAENG